MHENPMIFPIRTEYRPCEACDGNGAVWDEELERYATCLECEGSGFVEIEY
jgi:DnaJ-class molecular chaperone